MEQIRTCIVIFPFSPGLYENILSLSTFFFSLFRFLWLTLGDCGNILQTVNEEWSLPEVYYFLLDDLPGSYCRILVNCQEWLHKAKISVMAEMLACKPAQVYFLFSSTPVVKFLDDWVIEDVIHLTKPYISKT